jgi:uncharacterized membrane protein HdeD (DUF308 family)
MSNKRGKEAKVERVTWFAMILVFMLLRFDPGRDVSFPEFLIPIIIATILLISGVYQVTQKWPVSPFTWIFAGVLMLLGIYGYFYESPVDLVLASLIITIAMLVVGIISNEG